MQLATWAGRSKFTYSGSVKTGTDISYGKGFPVSVSARQYTSLLAHFHKREVSIGTSRTTAPDGSVGRWLMQNVTRTAIASYVGPILIFEGYAAVGAQLDRIRFL